MGFTRARVGFVNNVVEGAEEVAGVTFVVF